MAGAAAAQAPLNFVFILADDLGWRDLSCFGSRFYETPHIDRLAAGGMRFTNAYAASCLCSPTRASIMTGKYPARLGFTHVTQFNSGYNYKPDASQRWIQPRSATELPLDEVTIAEALKTAGYTSGCIGKWHLGSEEYYPEKQGFDINVGGGHIAMPTSFFYPQWKENPRGPGVCGPRFRLRANPATISQTGCGTRQSGFWSRTAAASSSSTSHTMQCISPLRRSKKSAEIPGQSSGRRSAEQPRLRRHDREPRRFSRRRAEEVGRTGNRRAHRGDLLSDNGGVDTGSPRRPPSTSNAPLRLGKTTLYEGGIRTPLIVRWPGVVRPGSTCDTPVISNDFYPTLVEMAGIRKDPGNPIDGVSLTPLFKEQTGAWKRDALYWHFPHLGDNNLRPHGAIRHRDHKLIEYFEDGRLELYNLAEDIGESRNLVAKMPDRAREMALMLRHWREEVGARRLTPNPDYKQLL